eukprot:m.91925 g.91925  ORF g.91925 m.91925 type:complete len:756 (-) comp8622_c0_seq1:170-2437(-)
MAAAAALQARLDALARAAQGRDAPVVLDAADAAGLLAPGIALRDYQLAGTNWLLACSQQGHGAILGDEMGLGKTIQSIAFLAAEAGGPSYSGPHTRSLVVVPLSLVDNWRREFRAFAPWLDVCVYVGDKDERAEQRDELAAAGFSFHVLITTFDLVLRDVDFFAQTTFATLVVDEAHRLKNSESALAQALAKQVSWKFAVLLTGTPVQNNLHELFSLLQFVAPSVFREALRDGFVAEFRDIATNAAHATLLHKIIQPFVLRRTKDLVAAHLPDKTEVVLYTGLSEVQRKMYKAILVKDALAIEASGKASLMNTLMQLRKCINHPYLFDGVEPEPFEMGDHLITASGKLTLLDKLLPFLKKRGHHVLLFSQMTRVLDILQDYLAYREYNYERLDGSVRGEERYSAINNFNQDDDTFVFLLSTRAGGLGLNLTKADTVIFFDSDFNPQNDLQAIARAHRIGQTRPVRVVRLVARNTAEEVILRRARHKLMLTHAVIAGSHLTGASAAGGTDTAASDAVKDSSAAELTHILKFGLDKLLGDGSIPEPDLESILGTSAKGAWGPAPHPAAPADDVGRRSQARAVGVGHSDDEDDGDEHDQVAPNDSVGKAAASASAAPPSLADTTLIHDDEARENGDGAEAGSAEEDGIYHYMGKDYKKERRADDAAFAALVLQDASDSDSDGGSAALSAPASRRAALKRSDGVLDRGPVPIAAETAHPRAIGGAGRGAQETVGAGSRGTQEARGSKGTEKGRARASGT